MNGSWVEQTSLGISPWIDVSVAYDSGNVMAVVADGGYLYILNLKITSYWQAMTMMISSQRWSCVDISSTGDTIAAATYDGMIAISNDAGLNWVNVTHSTRPYYDIAISMEGSTASLITQNGSIWIYELQSPYDSFETYSQVKDGYFQVFNAIAADPTGQYYIAVAEWGYIWTSYNGFDWEMQLSAIEGTWISTAMSSTGQIMMGLQNRGYLYLSSNYGYDWTKVIISTSSTRAQWSAVACSSTAQYIVAAQQSGYIYFSGGMYVYMDLHRSVFSYPHLYLLQYTDGGNTWLLTNAPKANWYALAINDDASQIVALVYSSCIYLSVNQGGSWTAQVVEASIGM